ncbi:MAG: TonB-dependent receptor [Bacteroidales bacterium]|jgi:hypothetical protein|nr:TonB-dependent receptor [Bacteroidales bacterium]
MNKLKSVSLKITLLFLVASFCSSLYAKDKSPVIEGVVKDAKSSEKIAYAHIVVEEMYVGATSDTSGYFTLSIPSGKYRLRISYPTHITQFVEVNLEDTSHVYIHIALEPNSSLLESISIVTERNKNTESVVIEQIKEAQTVASGVSNEQIVKSQDKDAAEVVKRIPGVTIMDDRFIVIRGLSLRYNDVWLNSGIAPSSESDSRAFSFDFIPSGMIQNILVYKNFSADMLGDFAGGFVKVQTMETPNNQGLQIGYGIGFRTHSVFRPHASYSQSGWDVLGAGTIPRGMPKDFPAHLKNVNLNQACNYVRQLSNNWEIHQRMALPDQSLSFSFSNQKRVKSLTISNIVYLSYHYYNDHTTLENNQYGIYDIGEGKPVFNKQYNDTVYQEVSKINLGYNLCFFTRNGHKIRFKNLFQNIGNNKTSFREGRNYSNDYYEKSQEFFYKNRLTYAAQLESSHDLKNRNTDHLDWTLGYAYVLNNEPDRRIMDARKDVNENSPYVGQYRSMDNDIRRYFQTLTEHNVSLNVNYNHTFKLEKLAVGIKTGLYSEYKTRDFQIRNFAYKKSIDNNLPQGYFYYPYPEMFDPQYVTPDGFYLAENTGKSDSYNTFRLTDAVYALASLEVFNVALHTGLRMEQSLLNLDSYESDGVKPVHVHQNTLHFLPSVNLAYTIKKKHIIRTAYGITVNRPEFREVAPYVYYDFDNFSYYEGNPELKEATVHNVDLRYEFYPNREEMISFGGFYKHFINPIENTYYHAGGQYQYTYMNAHSAVSYGLELDIRKSLYFMKLKNFSLVLNASLLKSQVIFPDESIELGRSMQGQSPFIVNTGLYYDNTEIGLTFSILHNIIGKRIVAVGQVNQNANENIPDTYQMPRHSLDVSIQQKVGKFKLYVSAKNILNQKIIYTQMGVYSGESKINHYTQNTKVIKTGVQISTGFTLNF